MASRLYQAARMTRKETDRRKAEGNLTSPPGQPKTKKANEAAAVVPRGENLDSKMRENLDSKMSGADDPNLMRQMSDLKLELKAELKAEMQEGLQEFRSQLMSDLKKEFAEQRQSMQQNYHELKSTVSERLDQFGNEMENFQKSFQEQAAKVEALEVKVETGLNKCEKKLAERTKTMNKEIEKVGKEVVAEKKKTEERFSIVKKDLQLFKEQTLEKFNDASGNMNLERVVEVESKSVDPGAPDIILSDYERRRVEAFVTGISEEVPEWDLKNVVVRAFREGAKDWRGLETTRIMAAYHIPVRPGMPGNFEPRVKLVFVDPQSKNAFFREREQAERTVRVSIYDNLTKAERNREALKGKRIKEFKDAKFNGWRLGYGGILSVNDKPYGDYNIPFAEWRARNATMGGESK
jgi:DNA polymerase III alpha subunit (gram-positive type)